MILIDIVLLASSIAVALCADDQYLSQGCYADKEDSAISGGYVVFKKETVDNCFRMAEDKGFEIFAIEDGNKCYTSSDAYRTFRRYGPSRNCFHGRGGLLAMDVYRLRPTSRFLLNKMHLVADESRKNHHQINVMAGEIKGKQDQIDVMSTEIQGKQVQIDRLASDLILKEKEIALFEKTAENNYTYIRNRISIDERTRQDEIRNISIRITTDERKSQADGKRISSAESSIENNSRAIVQLNKTVGLLLSQKTTARPKTASSTLSTSTSLTTETSTSARPTSAASTSLPSTTSGRWIYYPRGTTEHKAPRKLSGFFFFGYGYTTSDGGALYAALSVEECAGYCVKERMGDSRYNGFYWNTDYYGCFCAQNDNTHIKRNDFLHYRLR